jgi:hypothetical protein
MRNSVSWSRREFGIGLGAMLLAAPFLSALAPPRRARAAAGGPTARRLILFFSPNGTVHAHRRPTGTGASFAFPAGSILEPLAPIREHLTLIDGLDFLGADNHEGGMKAMLTGGGSGGGESAGMSVDQLVATRLGGATRFPSLELGVQTSAWGGNAQTRMSYSGPGQFVPPDDDPASVYRRLWGELGGTPGEVDANLRRRRSVIDLAKHDLDRLRTAVGSEERAKLDQHLAALRQMEQGLGGGSGGTCTSPVAPAPVAPYVNDQFPTVGRAQLDLLLAAVGCGLTNVASIQFAHTVAPQVFSWLGLGEGHHSLSHIGDDNQAGVAQFVAAERWFAEQFVYLVQRLAETPDPEGGGTLLDTSLVVWSKEMGDSRLHVCKDVPFVLAGKAGGYLAPPRYLKLAGESHQKLLVAISQAMGLTNQTFGDGSGGSGPLAGLA